MKSIDNKAVRNLVEKKLNIMMGANDMERLNESYAELRSALKQYYDACAAIAEYNNLISAFSEPTVEYEPIDS